MNHQVEIRQRAEREKLEALKERLAFFDQFLADDEIQEIAVNHNGEVVLWRHGNWENKAAPEITFDFMKDVGAALGSYVGRPFNREGTTLTAFLPGGERVEMTHPPTSPEGVIYINIRKHSATAFPHALLVEKGYYKHVRHEKSLNLSESRRQELLPHLSEEEKELWDLAEAGKWPDFMVRAVQLHQNIVVSGATGSGKTSYCRSLIEMIDTEERILTIEDSPEMPLPNHPNNNQLFYKKRAEDKEGATAKDVLHSVMRKTPTRVLLAELRGDEAMFYLSGVLSSGHPGGITTTHANSPRDAFFRLALLILTSDAGKSLDMNTILMLLNMTVNVVVQLKFDREKGRYIPGIFYDPMYRLSLLG